MGKRKSLPSSSEGSASEGENADIIEEEPARKRISKLSSKKSALEKENLDTEKKKLAQLQKRIKQLEKKQPKQVTRDISSEDEFESEEEADPPSTPFSSSIRPLAAITVPNTTKPTQLKRIGAAAAKAVPRISANAFKSLPLSNLRQESPETTEAQSNHMPSSNDGNMHGTTPPAAMSSPLSSRTTHLPAPATAITHAATGNGCSGVDPILKVPAFREGVTPDPKNPKASDYEDTVTALILRAAFEYEALISTANAFPDTTLRHKWARKCWKHAGLDADEQYQMTEAISTLLRQRGSRIRGHAVTSIRACVANIFGFKKKADPRTITNNIGLFRKLKDNSSFHYKVRPETQSGYAQGKIISECLQSAWFENKDSHGVVFEKLFNPVPFEIMALILTILDFCLDEWSSGKFEKATLWEKNVIARHKVFREDLEKWGQQNESVIKALRKKLYTRARRDAGAAELSTVKSSLTADALDRVRAELEGRTGETDSEAEQS
ncbi:hypothetical protein BDZ97DRAFT_1931639 [Flammula alnicola]|nr:hypothetical protein BDZ97DRAFT_1931639 [Flammula alnicola]